MSKLLILHLSDAHISTKDKELWGAKRAEIIARSALQGGPYAACLLVFAGDVSNRGQVDELELAEEFLLAIRNELKQGLVSEPVVVVAPGNHDCDLSAPNALRDFALTQRAEGAFVKPEILEVLAKPLENFRAFEAKVDNLNFVDRGIAHKSGVFNVGNVEVQIRVFNSPLYTKIREQKGDLFLPESLFAEGWNSDAIRISIMHHPSPWFDQSISRGIRSELRNNSTITLYGHEHIPEISEISSYNKNVKNGSIEIDGGVLHGHGAHDECSFVSVELDVDAGTVRANSHIWNKQCFVVNSLLETVGSPGFVKLPAARLHFAISVSFGERLKDAGISVQLPSGRAMVLRDIYVDLDLYKGGRKRNVDELVKVSDLLSNDYLEGGLIIQGEEKFGKTSLFYRLFDAYHEKGLVPVYISLKDHAIKKGEDFIKVLKNSIAENYAGESYDTYTAVERVRKVIFVDDIDTLRTNALRTNLISFLKVHTDFFVLSTTSRIKLEEVLTVDASEELGKLPQLMIDRFSSAKRSDLIAKWVSATQADLDDEEFVSRIDTLEKASTAVLGHNMVPRVPQMLLIFLQSSNSVGKSSLESGALASYYTYLVTQQLLTAGVRKDEVDEYLSFSRLVAFKMHQSDSEYISLKELEECNSEFSLVYYPGGAAARRNVLVNARLLESYGGDAYRWRHAYFRYLFLGGYLGTNMDESGVRAIIEDMCQHMYVLANANTLLFLAHFSKDPFVFKSIEAVVQNLFSSASPLSLGKDTQVFSEIMSEVKRLYVPDDVMQERKSRAIRRAATEDHHSDGIATNKKLDKLSVLEELTVLFKTSEIIGQVLKEQYASIKRSTREPVVVELFQAYMRACGGIISLLTDNTEALKKWIEAKISKDSKTLSSSERALAATEVVSELVQMFMFAFFQKLGDSISSDKTIDLIQNISWENKVESEMFLLACELNLQRSIPIGKIDNLLKLAGKDAAFIALIRNLVQMRVKMFHTRGSDLQALSKRFHIPIERLKALDFSDPQRR